MLPAANLTHRPQSFIILLQRPSPQFRHDPHSPGEYGSCQRNHDCPWPRNRSTAARRASRSIPMLWKSWLVRSARAVGVSISSSNRAARSAAVCARARTFSHLSALIMRAGGRMPEGAARGYQVQAHERLPKGVQRSGHLATRVAPRTTATVAHSRQLCRQFRRPCF